MQLPLLSLLLLLPQGPPPQLAQNGIAAGQIRSLDGGSVSSVRVAAVVPESKSPNGGPVMVSLTFTDASGHYRLANVPPGRYYIQAGLPDAPTYFPGVTSMTAAASVLISAGVAVEGLDFAVVRPAGVRVTGRIPVVKGQNDRVSLRGPMSLSAIPAVDGTFEFLRVTPGEYTLSASASTGLPSRSIVVRDKDVVVGVVPGTGVKVSGVVGLGPNSAKVGNQRVLFTGATAWTQTEASVDATGRFEFAAVPPGVYSVRTIPGISSSLATVTITDSEIADLMLPASVEITGRVGFEGAADLPAPRTALMIKATRSDGSAFSTAVGRDGKFRLPILEGEYQMSVDKLPPGLSLKSMNYGSVDLVGSVLKLDGASPLQEIRLILEAK